MKLAIKKLWFLRSVDEIAESLFRIPQMDELFDGYEYAGEIRPRGIKICPGYWPADPILQRMTPAEGTTELILTGLELKGDFGRIDGKGYDGKAIASDTAYVGGINRDIFDPTHVGFNAMVFHEVTHALGLNHHDFDPLNPCEMSANLGFSWRSLEEVRVCDDCYSTIN